uniref:Oligopeptide transporter 1-like n=1 Tax=Quercus lobata TaxID=97700 RepID=A0A7N2LQW0_QUELO
MEKSDTNVLPSSLQHNNFDPAAHTYSESSEEVNDSPIEQVRLTVPITDDPTLPCLTFRTWFLGITSCAVLTFLNQFFGYRQNALYISSVSAQIVVLPIGKFMAAYLPNKFIHIPGTKWFFSLNPGPFNLKEHVLITIFANSGSNSVYAVGIITIVKAFYHRGIHPLAAILLSHTTQLLGYGWAGLYRKLLVDSPYMWWPSNLVQVSLFRALHDVETRPKGGLTRLQFFIVALVTSFSYYIVPNYLFPSITALSFVCWIWKDSVTAQQIGSGLRGLGIGSFALDWSTVAGFLGSPLATPGFAIINIMAGFFIVLYIVIPIAYWTNSYEAKRFPIYSSHYWLQQSLMLHSSMEVLLAIVMALFFTLPIGVITATTNQEPGLNVITEMIIGYMYPGRPLANVAFKTYGYISMTQAIMFLSDFKLGHYMKIPPKSMFIVQLVGTLVASSVYFSTAWWLLTSVEHICEPSKLPEGSPWTCPGDDVFYNASIIWGVVSPLRMFGRLGLYSKMNYFFLIGFLAPLPVWVLSRLFPEKKWIRLINMPIIIGGSGGMPPARAVNYLCWGAVGIFFNFFVYRRYKGWWARHNYILSAGLDAGVAFMAILCYFTLQIRDINGIRWWGLDLHDHCPLASCPTAPGIEVEGCPVFH